MKNIDLKMEESVGPSELWSCQILRLLPSLHYTHNLIPANCFSE